MMRGSGAATAAEAAAPRRAAPLLERVARSRLLPVAMDLTVMVKTVLASLAVLELTSPSSLITCTPESTRPDCTYSDDSNDGVADDQTYPAEDIRAACRPSLRVAGAHGALVVMIGLNMTIFVALTVLKNCRDSPWLRPLRRHALRIAFALPSVAFLAAMCKIALVSYISNAKLLFGCPGSEGLVGHGCYWFQASLPVQNSDLVACARENDGKIPDDVTITIECEDACTKTVPFEAQLLMFNFALAFFYMAYLAYEFYAGKRVSSSIVVSRDSSRFFEHWEARRSEMRRIIDAEDSGDDGNEEGDTTDDDDDDDDADAEAEAEAAALAELDDSGNPEALRRRRGSDGADGKGGADPFVAEIVRDVAKLQDEAKKLHTRELRSVRYRSLRDLAAFVKFALTTGSLVGIVTSTDHVLACSPVAGDGVAYVSGEDVLDACGPHVFLTPVMYGILCNFAATILVFVVVIVVDKTGSFREHSKAVCLTLLALTVSLGVLQVALVLRVFSLHVFFSCGTEGTFEFSNVENRVRTYGFCEVAPNKESEVYHVGGEQCMNNCHVTLPGSAAFLLANCVGSFIYLACLTLVYYRNTLPPETGAGPGQVQQRGSVQTH